MLVTVPVAVKVIGEVNVRSLQFTAKVMVPPAPTAALRLDSLQVESVVLAPADAVHPMLIPANDASRTAAPVTARWR